MFVCKDQSNVIKMLRKQIADLEDEKESVKRYAEDSSSYRTKEAQSWLQNTTNLIKMAHKLVDDIGKHRNDKCPVGLCLNPRSPSHLRKKAEQICKDIAAHVQRARGFSNIPPSYRQEKVVADRFEDFESRSGVLEDIMEALRSPFINKIGVYGKPGIGKTMLVREVKRRAEQEWLFDAVVMATVGRNPNFSRIQDEIARVSNEQTRLIEKVLVILDDVSESGFYLELVGINGKEEDNVVSYKILLTSRDRDIVSPLSETQIEIGKLAWEDAWNLFKKIADDPNRSRGLPFYANEITKKCEELPIAVATLANALRERNLIEWKTTQRKLQSLHSDQANSSQIPQSLHLAIELHYSGLKSKELQQTFLLCSLLGQNATIQNLLKYGIGLGLFPGVKSIEEARAQVLNLVTKLRDSSLLLDGGSSSYFDMHNLVRDFAISTASKEYGVLALRDDAPINLSNTRATESIKWIYLSNGDTNPLPGELKCLKLTFVHLSKRGPSLASQPNLFRDKEELKVLSLSKLKFLSNLSSISLPKNLCTLCLDQVVLGVENIGTMIGELENLQVLSLAGSDIKELPKQMGQLTMLKMLDLNDCTQLKVIPPGVLSCLSRLEELYMRNSFDQWGEGFEEHENQNVSLVELKHLKFLTAIEVHIICNIQKIPEGLFSGDLARFKVFLGDRWNNWNSSQGSSKLLKLKRDARISSHHSVRKLLKKTNELHLEGLIGVKNVVNELDEGGFQELKCLFVEDALEIQNIILAEHAFPILEVLVLRNLKNMEKICHGPLGATSFRKLRLITIACCNKLKNLFSSSIAKQLKQLQEIRVKDCNNMEEIVDDKVQQIENDAEEHEGHIVKLITLLSLRLQHLPKLKFFNSSCKTMTLFNEKVVFPNLEELQLSSIMVNNTIWCTSMTSCVERLTKLIIHGCDNLEYLFSSSMARGLLKLRHLQVKECKMMRMVIISEQDEQEKLTFSQLKFLMIEKLQNLVGFYSGNCIMEFPSLKHLQVLNCLELEGFIVKSSARTNVTNDRQPLFNKKGCDNLESQSLAQDLEGVIQLFLPKLKRLELGDLPAFKSICSRKVVMVCNVIVISNCEGLQRIPLYLPLLDDGQPSPPPSLKQIVVWSEEWWESFDWGHPNAKDVLRPFLTFYGSKRMKFTNTDIDGENIFLLPSVQELVIHKCNNLRRLNDISAIQDAKELKCCRIRNCQSLEYVLSLPINPLVQKIEVLDLSNLEILDALFEAEAIAKSPLPPNTFSSLKKIIVLGCQKIKKLFPFRMCLQSLEKIEISYCKEMEEIMAWDAEEEVGGEKEGLIQLILPKLKSLKLTELPTLKSICRRRVGMVCDSLEEIRIWNCTGLRRIPLYLPLLDNGQPSPPPSLRQINVWPKEWGKSWWESLEWDHPNAKDVLLLFREFKFW